MACAFFFPVSSNYLFRVSGTNYLLCERHRQRVGERERKKEREIKRERGLRVMSACFRILRKSGGKSFAERFLFFSYSFDIDIVESKPSKKNLLFYK
jgi:hypothetical protein